MSGAQFHPNPHGMRNVMMANDGVEMTPEDFAELARLLPMTTDEVAEKALDLFKALLELYVAVSALHTDSIFTDTAWTEVQDRVGKARAKVDALLRKEVGE